jgi:hypothetical protein
MVTGGSASSGSICDGRLDKVPRDERFAAHEPYNDITPRFSFREKHLNSALRCGGIHHPCGAAEFAAIGIAVSASEVAGLRNV